MMHYVVGFAFDHGNLVALIRKKRPKWQAGMLNGIGGKIELMEKPHDAMVREFREETGVTCEEWREFIQVVGSGWSMHCFTTRAVPDFYLLQTTTDEEVVLVDATNLPDDVLFNLRWMIPMAQDYDLRHTVQHIQYS
jgi:8-oxo-dGTP diphosphatase